jgi:sec-independent protein translocase protein TatC
VRDIDDSKAPLLDHLIELRRRLIYCVAALVVTFGVAYWQSRALFGFLVHPYAEVVGAGAGQLVYTKLYEAFFVQIKVAFQAAFFLSFPIIANQLWAFIAPGLYRQEKRALLPFLIATPFLFGLGGAVAYFFAVPNFIRFGLNSQKSSEGIHLNALPSIGDYFSIVTNIIWAFGVAFLLPVLLMLLERAGIVTRAQLVSGRRYAIVAATVIAAVLTPPDILSQVSLAVPLVILYESALIAMWFTQRSRDKAARRLPVVQ